MVKARSACLEIIEGVDLRPALTAARTKEDRMADIICILLIMKVAFKKKNAVFEFMTIVNTKGSSYLFQKDLLKCL